MQLGSFVAVAKYAVKKKHIAVKKSIKAAVAQIRPPAWELSYATRAALKRQKKKKRDITENVNISVFNTGVKFVIKILFTSKFLG